MVCSILLRFIHLALSFLRYLFLIVSSHHAQRLQTGCSEFPILKALLLRFIYRFLYFVLLLVLLPVLLPFNISLKRFSVIT